MLRDFQGSSVYLTSEGWQHIIHSPHAYMADMLEAIEDTLRNPDEIRRSNTQRDTVRLYYKWTADTVVGDKWVYVVVKYVDGDAFVLTALQLTESS
jgi:hypothetical protein